MGQAPKADDTMSNIVENPEIVKDRVALLALELERAEFIDCDPLLQPYRYTKESWVEVFRHPAVRAYRAAMRECWSPIPTSEEHLRRQLTDAERRAGQAHDECCQRLTRRMDGICDGGIRRYCDAADARDLAKRNAQVIKERIRLRRLDQTMQRRVKNYSAKIEEQNRQAAGRRRLRSMGLAC